MSQELKVEIVGIIGAASPFWQGGSIRITLPKRLGRTYGLGRKENRELENFTFIFIETDKGVLISPMQEVLQDKDMRETFKPRQRSH